MLERGVEQSHALFDHALGAGQAGAALVGEEFAHRADAAAAEVIDVVDQAFLAFQFEQVLDRRDEILTSHHPVFVGNVEVELEIDLVASNATEVVFFRIEEHALEHALGVGHGRRIARAQLAVDVFERFFLVVRGIFAQRLDDGVIGRDVDHGRFGDAGGEEARDGRLVQRFESIGQDDFAVLDVLDQHLAGQFILVEAAAQFEVLRGVEKINDVLVGRITHGAEEGRREKLAAALAAVHVDVEQIVGVELHFDPRAAVRNDAEAVKDFAVGVDGRLEADAGRAVELADNDALGPVDDERALRGHERKFAHVDFFFFRALLVLEAEGHMERRAEGFAFALRFERAELGRTNVIADILEHHFFVITRNGEHFAKNGFEAGVLALGRRGALLQEFLVGIDLQLDEVGRFRGFLEFSEVETI